MCLVKNILSKMSYSFDFMHVKHCLINFSLIISIITSYFIPICFHSQNNNCQCLLPTPERLYLIYLGMILGRFLQNAKYKTITVRAG